MPRLSLLLTQLLAHFGQFPRRQVAGRGRCVISLGGLDFQLPIGFQGCPQICAALLACGLTFSARAGVQQRLRECAGSGKPDGCEQQM